MHALSRALVFAFGAATLILHDQRFIQWKPTVFFWLVSARLPRQFLDWRAHPRRAPLGQALGARPACRRQWRRLNWLWIVVLRRCSEPQSDGRVQCQQRHLGQLQSLWSHGAHGRVHCRAAHLAVSARRPARPPLRPDARPWPPPPPCRARSGRAVSARLERELAPLHLEIRDDSAKHAGHAGAREGGHFRSTSCPSSFAGAHASQRHRLVYAGSGASCMRHEIHALAVNAQAPEEITSVNIL